VLYFSTSALISWQRFTLNRPRTSNICAIDVALNLQVDFPLDTYN